MTANWRFSCQPTLSLPDARWPSPMASGKRGPDEVPLMQFITQDLDLGVDAHKLVPFGVPDCGAGMSEGAALPKASDFPAGTTFVIKEFDVPLTWIPARGWLNWYGGAPRQYDPQFLTVANNWPADSFEEWVRIVESSLPQTPLIDSPDPPQST